MAVNAGAKVIATTRSRDRFPMLEALGAVRAEVEGPDLSRRIAEAGKIDAVLDLVGNSTILDSLAMLRRGGRACLAGWLGGLAPIADFNPLLQMASGVYLTFFGSFVFGKPGFPLSDVPAAGDRGRRGGGPATRRSRRACSASRRSARRIASWSRTRPAGRWSSSTIDRLQSASGISRIRGAESWRIPKNTTWSSWAAGRPASSWPGRWPRRGSAWRSSSGGTSAGPAPTSPACRARTSSTAPRSPTTSAGAPSSGSPRGDWKVDMAAVRDRKRKMVDGLVAIHLEKYRESGAELVMGQRALRRAEDHRGRAQRGRDPDAPRPDRRHRHRVARPDRRHPRPRGGAPADPRRGPGAGPAPGAPDRPGRRLRGPRAGAGVPPLRQPRDRRRAERRADPPRGPGRHRGGRAALPGRGDRGPDRDRRRSRRGEVRRVRPPAHGAAARSRGRTCSSPGAARRTPTASAWRRPGSRRTSGGTSRSTSGSGRRPRASGRWATAPAARTSRTSARTTSAWCWPTSPAGTA